MVRDISFLHLAASGPEPGYDRIEWVEVVRANPVTLTVEKRVRVAPRWESPTWPPPAGSDEDQYMSRAFLGDVRTALNGTVLAGHDVAPKWAFLREAHRLADLSLPDVDERAVDTLTLAWPLVHAGFMDAPSLEGLCERFGIELDPGALKASANQSYELHRKLTRGVPLRLFTSVASLAGDEVAIATELVHRLHLGRDEYGPWKVRDGRDYPREALEEVFDALNYVAAQLVLSKRVAA